MERLKVWFKNLRHWKTARAVKDLKRAMAKDPDFAHVWKCNIAMPIYDDTGLPMHQCNRTADRLMKHLFDVPHQ